MRTEERGASPAGLRPENPPPAAGALDGVKVLDLSRVLAGPYCTMVLADYGAEVIKVEAPGQGDDTRQWGPPYAGGESAYYLAINRNKRSLTVNLKRPEGIAIIYRLAARSDVVVENFRTGQAGQMGIGYEALRELNPGLIYCAITGYGQTGPLANRPGYDFAIQAQSGLMSITGPVQGPPSKVGVALADVMTGMHAAVAILAALHHRQLTGEGQYIDIALFDSQLAALVNVAQSFLVTGRPPQRYGNGHPTIVPYQSFDTADGTIALGVGNDGQWQRFCVVLDRPDLAADARFATNPQRVAHREELIPFLAAILSQRPSGPLLATLAAADIPAAPVNDLPQALADPQVQARDLIRHVAHPTIGDLPLIGPPARLSETPPSVRIAPPLLGQHTKDILTELGYTDDGIAALRACDAI